MHRLKSILKDGATLVGAGLVIYGAYSIYSPAAFILSGVSLLYLTSRMERAGD